MNIRDLDNKHILDDFFYPGEQKEKIDRAVIIDGQWGCGKTYTIKKYIEKHIPKEDKRKIKYVSLYGAKDIDDIKIKVRVASWNRFKSFLAGLTGATVKAASAVTPVDFSSDIDQILNNLISQDYKFTKKNKIFIFDDLERTGENFSYIELMGYFNDLIAAGSRILCLCSSDNIGGDDDHKKKEFEEFKEKTFQQIYKIDKTFDETIVGLFRKIKHEDIADIIGYFDNNIRLAQKTADFLENVEETLKDLDIDYTKLYSVSLLERACLCTIKFVFREPLTQSTKPYSKTILMSEDDFGLDKTTISLIQSFFKKVGDDVYINNHDNIILTKCLISFYYNQDKQILVQCFSGIIDNVEEQVLNMPNMKQNQISSLTSKYINQVQNNVIKFSTIHDIESLLIYLRYSKVVVSYELSNMFADRIGNEIIDYNEYEKINSFKIDENSDKEFLIIIERAKNVTLLRNSDSQQIAFSEAYNQGDYKRLTSLLDDICHRFGNLKTAERILSSNNFYFPDFNSNVSNDQWDYCKTLFNYAGSFEFDIYENFLDVLKEKLECTSDGNIKNKLFSLASAYSHTPHN